MRDHCTLPQWRVADDIGKQFHLRGSDEFQLERLPIHIIGYHDETDEYVKSYCLHLRQLMLNNRRLLVVIKYSICWTGRSWVVQMSNKNIKYSLMNLLRISSSIKVSEEEANMNCQYVWYEFYYYSCNC